MFPARIARDGNGFDVSYIDIPEALPGTSTREEALALANALITAMNFYFEYRRQVPWPPGRRRRQGVIDLPPSVGAKVLLLNEPRQQSRPPNWRRHD
jgi:antitoxin HicB